VLGLPILLVSQLCVHLWTKSLILCLLIGHWKDEISNIKCRLDERGLRSDIEIILTALTILTDESKIQNYLIPLLGITDMKFPLPRRDVKALLQEVRKLIYVKCMKFDRTQSSLVYGALSRGLNPDNVYRVLFTSNEGGERLNEDSNPITYKVFTTNYDTIFETSMRMNNIDYSDGFTPQQQDFVFNNEWEQGKVEVAKLHGSIDYYLRERDERVVRYPLRAEENDTDLFGERLKERMMILPIGEKYVTRTPYLQLLNKLSKDLINEEIVVMIGYSFRDDPINNVLLERIHRKERIKIVVVLPNATEIIRDNLPQRLQEVSVPLNISFGDITSVEQIHNAVVNRECGDGF
jgi:hypothetical protein